MNLQHKNELRQKRIWRIRRRIRGTAERPRLCVHFSNKQIYAQIINDETGRTLAHASTLEPDLRGEKLSANKAGAVKLGQLLGQKAKAAGLGKVVFDRHGRLYHGNVKAFAESARQAGLEF